MTAIPDRNFPTYFQAPSGSIEVSYRDFTDLDEMFISGSHNIELTYYAEINLRVACSRKAIVSTRIVVDGVAQEDSVDSVIAYANSDTVFYYRIYAIEAFNTQEVKVQIKCDKGAMTISQRSLRMTPGR